MGSNCLSVTPAKAGVQVFPGAVDSRLRGNDTLEVGMPPYALTLTFYPLPHGGGREPEARPFSREDVAPSPLKRVVHLNFVAKGRFYPLPWWERGG